MYRPWNENPPHTKSYRDRCPKERAEACSRWTSWREEKAMTEEIFLPNIRLHAVVLPILQWKNSPGRIGKPNKFQMEDEWIRLYWKRAKTGIDFGKTARIDEMSINLLFRQYPPFLLSFHIDKITYTLSWFYDPGIGVDGRALCSLLLFYFYYYLSSEIRLWCEVHQIITTY